MPNIKKYITRKRVKVSEYKYIDPNTDGQFGSVTSNATFIETPYKIADGRFISIVEYPDTTPQATIDWLIASYAPFEFTFIDEATANILLSELWDVTVSNFVFTDNRPEI